MQSTMKKFLFFDKEMLVGAGTAKQQFDIQHLEVTSCMAGGGFLFFGDASGQVSMFNMQQKMKMSVFQVGPCSVFARGFHGTNTPSRICSHTVTLCRTLRSVSLNTLVVGRQLCS
jgi:hypothetical protein